MSEALVINQLLETSNELSAFCTQNGWIINDSINYEILERHPDHLLIYVTFLESIRKAPAASTTRNPAMGACR